MKLPLLLGALVALAGSSAALGSFPITVDVDALGQHHQVQSVLNDGGQASCSGDACIAIGGEASCSAAECIAVGTESASCASDDTCVAIADHGDASCRNQTIEPCLAGSVDGTANGKVAVSVLGCDAGTVGVSLARLQDAC